jgi:phosphoglycolate phosphatase-like HAD superfamily hydrolase
MFSIDDTDVGSTEKLEIVRHVGRRSITHAVHDVDGTHSLIRDWPPVMSRVIHYAMTCGLVEDFDSDAAVRSLIEDSGARKLEETDRFCVESAGLSALTQMEFGIRRAVELGNIPATAGVQLTDEERRGNSGIVERIWQGEERFDDVPQPESLRAFIRERTPRLFRLYETVLNGACRDRNTADAWKHPERWRVPGSLEFMRRLHSLGCVNYFVTGAVIYPEGGMYEEVRAVRFEVGEGKMVEALEGSTWDRKMPKDEVMRALFRRLAVDPARVLVIGDGRSEIKAGVDMGCVAMSRLPSDARRPRELHRSLGVNYIVTDYTDPILERLIRGGR